MPTVGFPFQMECTTPCDKTDVSRIILLQFSHIFGQTCGRDTVGHIQWLLSLIAGLLFFASDRHKSKDYVATSFVDDCQNCSEARSRVLPAEPGWDPPRRIYNIWRDEDNNYEPSWIVFLCLFRIWMNMVHIVNIVNVYYSDSIIMPCMYSLHIHIVYQMNGMNMDQTHGLMALCHHAGYIPTSHVL